MATKRQRFASPRAAITAPAPPSDLLADLREIYDKLDAIDTKNMNPEEQQVWFGQYTKTRQAIMVAESNTLDAINQQLGAVADDVTAAIGDCEKALHGVQETATVIRTVATALGAIAKIAVLFA